MPLLLTFHKYLPTGNIEELFNVNILILKIAKPN